MFKFAKIHFGMGRNILKEYDDNEVVQLLQKRDERGLALAISRYGRAVKTICRNILADCDEMLAEDAVSSSFAKIWLTIEGYDESKGSFKGWIYGIARNTAVDVRRREARHGVTIPLEEDYIGEEGEPESEYTKKQNSELLHEVIKEMQEPDKTVFILRYFYYFSVGDIADKLGLTYDNTAYRLKKGKQTLKKALLERGFIYEN